MTEPKTKYPIEAFGPELMAALLAGGRRRIVLQFPNDPADDHGSGRRLAHKFQLRINMLRQRMRQTDHEGYTLAARARCGVFWGEKATTQGGPAEWKDDHDGKRGALVVIRPHDIEFLDVLKAASIQVDAAVPAVVGETPVESGDYDDVLKDYLLPEPPEE